MVLPLEILSEEIQVSRPSGIRHPQVIYLGGDRIFQAPETGQDVGYGTLSEFGRQIASMRRIEVPQQVALG